MKLEIIKLLWDYAISMKPGQTLVILLVFMAIAVTVTAAAVVMMIVGSTSASQYERSQSAYTAAESGAENALLRLLRDPNYLIAGETETLTIGSATATIAVTGTDPKTITSTGVSTGFTRQVKVIVGYTNGILTVTSWSEIFN